MRPNSRVVLLVLCLFAAPLYGGERKNSPYEWVKHVIAKSESLWSIAAQVLNDSHRWPEIYELNQSRIVNPNLIFAGDSIRFRRSRKVAIQAHVVKKGESLWLIAMAEYGDPLEYVSILEANSQLMGNPNFIFPGQSLRIPKAQVECETIWQSTVSPSALLIADYPAGAALVAGEYWVRYASPPGSPWAKCEPGQNNGEPCRNINLPPLQLMDADPFGTKRFRVIVTAVQHVDNNVAHSAVLEARLITRYLIVGPACVSQATFEVAANDRHGGFLYAPSGKTILSFSTQARRLDAGSQWTTCDDNVNGAFAQRDSCRATRRIYFGFAELRDLSDGLVGKYFLCHEGKPDAHRGDVKTDWGPGGCRAMLTYQP